jgi:hypothetical protein
MATRPNSPEVFQHAKESRDKAASGQMIVPPPEKDWDAMTDDERGWAFASAQPQRELADVQQTVGYTSLTTTSRYSHARPAESSGLYLAL